MIQITVDGQPTLPNIGQIKNMCELVELIKAAIDPDKMISSMTIDKRELSDDDWKRSLSSFTGGALEIVTDLRENYVRTRVTQAPTYLQQITDRITNTRTLYQAGNSFQANQEFKVAVADLSAYMNWYLTLLSLDKQIDSAYMDHMVDHIEEIGRTCQAIVNYMLYNSWWAVADTLEKNLEPQLKSFHSSINRYCEQVSNANSLAIKFAN